MERRARLGRPDRPRIDPAGSPEALRATQVDARSLKFDPKPPKSTQVGRSGAKKSILKRFWEDFSSILVPKSVPKRLSRKAVREPFFESVFERFFDDLPRFRVELAFLRT